MEMLEFYSLSIIVGIFLSCSLGILGIHLVLRHKTLETLMVGQTMQLGVIVGAFIASYLYHETNSIHEGHFGIFTSLSISGIIYFFHARGSKRWYQLKTELALLIIVISIALSHILTALNPLIESHFTRSFVGDIVTASKYENYFLIFVGLFCVSYFFHFKGKLFEDSIDFALYGGVIEKRALGFEALVFGVMGLSIHVFGLLFTLGTLLLPIILLSLSRRLRYRTVVLLVLLGNSISVFTGFLLNIKYEKLPTSPTIVIVITLIYFLFAFIESRVFNSDNKKPIGHKK